MLTISAYMSVLRLQIVFVGLHYRYPKSKHRGWIVDPADNYSVENGCAGTP